MIYFNFQAFIFSSLISSYSLICNGPTINANTAQSYARPNKTITRGDRNSIPLLYFFIFSLYLLILLLSLNLIGQTEDQFAIEEVAIHDGELKETTMAVSGDTMDVVSAYT